MSHPTKPGFPAQVVPCNVPLSLSQVSVFAVVQLQLCAVHRSVPVVGSDPPFNGALARTASNVTKIGMGILRGTEILEFLGLLAKTLPMHR